MNLVSVLIPAYNHEKYVQETIRSIINQSYKNIELIVIDDGSKDMTWQKIQEMKEECEKRFINVYFQSKENEGTCATLNKLLSVAQGEYVYLIASDDLAKSNAIEEEVAFLEKNLDYSLVVGDNEIIDKESRLCYWGKRRKIVYKKDEAVFETFVDFLEKSVGFSFTTEDFGKYEKLYCANHVPNGYLIRKSIFDKIGNFTKEAPLEDYWLMLQISKYAKLKFLDKVLFSYRWHDSNSIKNPKIVDFLKKTREHENKLLLENKDNLSPNIRIIAENGILKKTKGIKYLFEICTYMKTNDEIRIIKILGMPIFRYIKKDKR